MPFSYLNLIWGIARLDLRLISAHYASVLQPLIFFLLVCSLFPLGLPPDPAILHSMGPSVIWVAVLLAHFIGLERLFTTDFHEGCLEQWCLSPYPLALISLIKVITHCVVTTLPMILVSPLIASWYSLSFTELEILVCSLILGSPVLSFVGAIGQALLVRNGNSGVLLALLIIPLYIPVLIFGAGSVVQVGGSFHPAGALAMLASLSLLSVVLAPFAIAGSLRLAL